MIETIASFDGRIAKVQGPARSGKTEALVRRCACLVRGGAAPETILVETSSAAAAQAFRRRLAARSAPTSNTPPTTCMCAPRSKRASPCWTRPPRAPPPAACRAC